MCSNIYTDLLPKIQCDSCTHCTYTFRDSCQQMSGPTLTFNTLERVKVSISANFKTFQFYVVNFCFVVYSLELLFFFTLRPLYNDSQCKCYLIWWTIRKWNDDSHLADLRSESHPKQYDLWFSMLKKRKEMASTNLWRRLITF